MGEEAPLSQTDDVVDDVDEEDFLLQAHDIDNLLADPELLELVSTEGVDLADYTRRVEDELDVATQDAVEGYVAMGDSLLQLHEQVQQCDELLSAMNEHLTNFQDNIGGISDEIQQMQSSSTDLTTQLSNRREVEEALCVVLNKLAIPPAVIRDICQRDVPTDSYLDYIDVIDACFDVFHNNTTDSRCEDVLQRCRAADGGADFHWTALPLAEDVGPVLGNLTIKISQQLHGFLMSKLQHLQKPKTNVSIIQHNVLLKYKRFYYFLQRHHPVAAQDVRQTYIGIMSHVYYTTTKSYITALLKLEHPGSSKALPILVDKPSAAATAAASLNKRDVVLHQTSSPLLVPHVEQQGRRRHFFEQLFRSLQWMLMDVVTNEFLFILDFFLDVGLYANIFSRTTAMCLEALAHWTQTTTDHYALLLCIRLTEVLSKVMEERRVPCLQPYFEQCNVLLWPKFKQLFDVNVEAMQAVGDVKDTTAHRECNVVTPLCERYSDFSASVLRILMCDVDGSGPTSPSSAAGMLGANMTYLGITFEGVLKTLAHGVLVSPRTRATIRTIEGNTDDLLQYPEPCAFLLNNATHVLRAWRLQSLSSTHVDFERLLRHRDEYLQAYVRAELRLVYPYLVDFLSEAERLVGPTPPGGGGGGGRGGSPRGGGGGDATKLQKQFEATRAKLDVARMEKVAQTMQDGWKQGMRDLHDNCVGRVGDGAVVLEVIKKMFTQLALYNTRFMTLVSKCWLNPPFRSILVSSASILHEARGYTPQRPSSLSSSS